MNTWTRMDKDFVKACRKAALKRHLVNCTPSQVAESMDGYRFASARALLAAVKVIEDVRGGRRVIEWNIDPLVEAPSAPPQPEAESRPSDRLWELVTACGGPAAAARIVGLESQAVSMWFSTGARRYRPSEAAERELLKYAGKSLQWLYTGVEPAVPAVPVRKIATELTFELRWIDHLAMDIRDASRERDDARVDWVFEKIRARLATAMKLSTVDRLTADTPPPVASTPTA